MSVIVKQRIDGQIDLEALKTVFEMAGHMVETPGEVTLHDYFRGTHRMWVAMHIPADVLTAMGLSPGRDNRYGLGLQVTLDGDVELIYDRFYAPLETAEFSRKLGNLCKVAKLRGKPVNVLYHKQSDQVLVQVAPTNSQPAGNAFMDGGKS